MSQSAASEHNPSYLPPRYEIRQLKPEHTKWACAVVMHSNMFHSPVWSLIYPEEKTSKSYAGLSGGDYLVEHQINSGMSFGVFDTQYTFKRPESAATGGALYWDAEANPNATGEELLEQMDFPLASVALAYDGINALDMARIMPLIEILPLFGVSEQYLEEIDPRPAESWKPTQAHEVLMRNATATRHDYEGEKLMKKLAQFLMREAKLKGYRGIQIDCFHDAVGHVWSHPPAPFQGEVVCSLDMATYEAEGEDGKKSRIYAPAKQFCTKTYVTL